MPSKKAATICIYPRKVPLQLQVYLNVWIAVQAVDDQMMHVMSCLHTASSTMPSETSQNVNSTQSISMQLSSDGAACDAKQTIQVCVQSGILYRLPVLKQSKGTASSLVKLPPFVASSQLRLLMHLIRKSQNSLVTKHIATDSQA